ncbi:tolQ [Wigglesworthia glossinidia endosymbiont of Glossina brevipalpis]|uniref:TolQ protein n=1 Tax=Wigglesworthia glossinidia brevipalpis TaxID=36870 RepID=Q8D2D9_WIGBR|nr:tolQ [Wigglesworthia glossinidia endosymbiont of Glossina brevipalpis]
MINTNIFDLFLKSDLILKIIFLFLFFCSITSWMIIFYKFFILRKLEKKMEIFEKKFWSKKNISNIYNDISFNKKELTGCEQIFFYGFKEFSKLNHEEVNDPQSVINGTKRAMNIITNREIEFIEFNLSTLGSISSVSPYVGLLGTVWSIMNTFYKIGGYSENITIQNIAPEISEALSTTAISLFVAIPALIAFNKLNVKSNIISQNYLNFSEELSAILHRKIFSKKTIHNNKYEI